MLFHIYQTPNCSEAKLVYQASKCLILRCTGGGDHAAQHQGQALGRRLRLRAHPSLPSCPVLKRLCACQLSLHGAGRTTRQTCLCRRNKETHCCRTERVVCAFLQYPNSVLNMNPLINLSRSDNKWEFFKVRCGPALAGALQLFLHRAIAPPHQVPPQLVSLPRPNQFSDAYQL